MTGELVSDLPPRRAWNRNDDVDWEKFAELAQENPGKAVLAAKHIRESRAKSVRRYPNPPFRQDNGRIKVIIRDSTIESDGYRYGDVWLMWEATKKKGK